MEKSLEILKNNSSPYVEQALGPRSVASTVSAPSAVVLPALETRQRLSVDVMLGLETRELKTKNTRPPKGGGKEGK